MDSRALQVNLQRTAVDVPIPPDQALLLDVVGDHYGIRRETEKLLRELNHPYPDRAGSLEQLHRRATQDFWHVNRHPEAPRAIALYLGFYAGIATTAPDDDFRVDAVRRALRYVEHVIENSGERRARNLEALAGAFDDITAVVERHPEAREHLPRCLARVTRALLEGDEDDHPLLTEIVVLLARSLDACYESWLERRDPRALLTDLLESSRHALPPGLDDIAHERLREARVQLTEVDGDDPSTTGRNLLDLPDEHDIARTYLEIADALMDEDQSGDEMAALEWLFHMLTLRALRPVRGAVLARLRRRAEGLLMALDERDRARFLERSFGLVRDRWTSEPEASLELQTILGRAAISSGHGPTIDHAVEEIIRCGFHEPDFGGFGDDWSARVNPWHVPNLRAWLSLIRQDPARTRRLLAALVVNVEVGGVFLADTDLFQRDVSALLGADIRPVYHTLKRLLKRLPVYYSEIGAEGELRDTSTEIDEITERRDPLVHFLRKQCHVESNPRLLDLVDAMVEYWLSGDRSALRDLVPEPLYDAVGEEDIEASQRHEVLRQVAGGGGRRRLRQLAPEEIESRLDALPESPGRERVRMLLRLRSLLEAKYELSHDDLLGRLREHPRVDAEVVDDIERAMSTEHHQEAVTRLLDILESLEEVVLTPGETRGIEDIYHKRHIAVGIPSMYGRYREERFEAMGLIFRTESLTEVLLERMIDDQNLRYITRSTLRRICSWLGLLLRALRTDGCEAKGLSMGVSMLDQALEAEAFTVDQYINVFEFIAQSINYLIRVRFLDVFEPVVEPVVGRAFERGTLRDPGASDRRSAVARSSERLTRELIAGSFCLQMLDRLVGSILQTLNEERRRLDRSTLNLLMSYDVDRCFADVAESASDEGGSFLLGYKGTMIRRLARKGLPVPPGFIISTEAFRCQDAIREHRELRREYVQRIGKHLALLEQQSGRIYGDPRSPLLLSVRSGAAISMPGMMDTFLNVGMNEEIAEGLANALSSRWAAWDAYRRFLQFWGMSFGIPRDLFDDRIQSAKERRGVPKKALLDAEQMRELAFEYRELLEERDVELIDDPFEQLLRCIELVQASWSSTTARAYREAMHIADEWGTAVIVQQMVFGNKSREAGTGVVFTRHPRRGGESMALYGDFVMQSQGDDVVSGLVETYPISADQQRSETGERPVSLESDFPRVFDRLREIAGILLEDLGMQHQDIEFTFEGSDREQLWILQSRDIHFSRTESVDVFVPSEELRASRAGTGIGVAGGALSGYVAHTADDLRRLREEHPDSALILLRPDTVPDDIPLILEADALLTAVGGATSHAAVAAQGLGKTCVVGCRELEVDEEQRRSSMAGHALESGAVISINGMDGAVYLGEHPVETSRRRGLLG